MRRLFAPVAIAICLLAARHALAQAPECDGTSGKRVQVIYVQPHGAISRYASTAGQLRIIAAGVDFIFDASAHKTGGHRSVRWVRNEDCQIDVAHVQLQPPGGTVPWTIAGQVAAQGYDSPDRKYLLFVDDSWIGVPCYATTYLDSTPGPENISNHRTGWATLSRPCWPSIWAAHELVHLLGGVQLDAPNSSGGWHCTDAHDLMCLSDWPFYPTLNYPCPLEHIRLLDCGDDDYFHTNPPPGSYLATHWNVADSMFLEDEERQVYVPMVMR